MLGLVVHIFCTFIFATRVVVCWQKKKKKKITILTSWIFFLALSDQEEFAWGKLWQIFSRTGEESCRLQMTDVFMPWGFFYFYTGVSVTNGSFIQTNKKERKILFKSDLSITSLSWTHWRHSLTWTLSHRQTFSIHPRQTGRVAMLCTA